MERPTILLINCGIRHPLAVPEHGHGVGDFEYLAQMVRYIDKGDPSCFQRTDVFKQPSHLHVGQRRGRLVQHDHLGLFAHGFEDFDHLLIGDGQVAHLGFRVDALHAEHRQHFAGLPVELLEVHQAQPSHRLAVEKYVLRDAELLHQAQFLKHNADAAFNGIPRRLEAGFLSLDVDFARVRLVDAAQHLDERGFARAVFAHQRVHLSGPDREIHAVQRLDAWERLHDAAALQYVFAHVPSPS
jgi:hypothetical protein